MENAGVHEYMNMGLFKTRGLEETSLRSYVKLYISHVDFWN